MPFYEAKGELKKKVKAHFAARQAAYKKQFAFSRRVGGNPKKTMQFNNSIGDDSWAILFAEEPDLKLWKKCKRSDSWTPRLSSKEGKELEREMMSIQAPGIGDLARLFNMGFWTSCPSTPGYRVKGDRYFIEIPEKHKPVDGLVRISDVELEKIMARMSRKKK